MPPTPLPIDALIPDLLASLREHGRLVVCAPPGSGKTTRIPPAILDGGFVDSGQIVLVEPRRLAARAAAHRISRERGGSLGDEVGYHVRFDRRARRETRLLTVTPGILLRRLQDDPFLESTSVVVFDEFHERSLECDFALGIVRLLRDTVRPDLRIVVMSATLDAEAVSRYLGECPVLASRGQAFPVEIEYRPKPKDGPLADAVAEAVEYAFERSTGDILVFLPGMGEIRRAEDRLAALASSGSLAVLPLHGDLPVERQDAALAARDRRRIVLSTNVAETSVTVEGVTVVVDSGLARQLEHDPSVGLDRLRLTPISKASADQRAGRAGRLAPGRCIRLWSESAHRARPDRIEPEIRRLDLAGVVLHLLAMGERDVRGFPWLDPPRAGAVDRATSLLERLGAIAGSNLTAIGQALSRLPLHPRLGRLVFEGRRLGQVRRLCLAAALLGERDPFERPSGETRLERRLGRSDLLERLEALESAACGIWPDGLSRDSVRFALRSADQLERELANLPAEVDNRRSAEHPETDADDAVLRAALAAFPDRLVRRREPGSDRGLMIGGKGVRLAPTCVVRDAELFVALDVDAREGEAWVRLASAVERSWLDPSRLVSDTQLTFDAEEERLRARRVTRFDDLVIEERPDRVANESEAARILAEAALDRLERVLPSPESESGQFLVRLRCLREWMPELSLPALDRTELDEVLTQLCHGRRSFDEVRGANWADALSSRMSRVQQLALDRHAPSRLEVPSGNRLALHYEAGRPPVLAVRIQEMFGCADGPRVAGGRVKVLLHLLAPNHRTQQVTDDLASFWKNTYAQVRKDLRARYPKHAWPEDPTTARPSRSGR